MIIFYVLFNILVVLKKKFNLPVFKIKKNKGSNQVFNTAIGNRITTTTTKACFEVNTQLNRDWERRLK